MWRFLRLVVWYCTAAVMAAPPTAHPQASQPPESAAQPAAKAKPTIWPLFLRHLMTAPDHRAEMISRFAVWDQITGVAGQTTTA
jgi:hypothetical protein